MVEEVIARGVVDWSGDANDGLVYFNGREVGTVRNGQYKVADWLMWEPLRDLAGLCCQYLVSRG